MNNAQFRKTFLICCQNEKTKNNTNNEVFMASLSMSNYWYQYASDISSLTLILTIILIPSASIILLHNAK